MQFSNEKSGIFFCIFSIEFTFVLVKSNNKLPNPWDLAKVYLRMDGVIWLVTLQGARSRWKSYTLFRLSMYFCCRLSLLAKPYFCILWRIILVLDSPVKKLICLNFLMFISCNFDLTQVQTNCNIFWRNISRQKHPDWPQE